MLILLVLSQHPARGGGGGCGLSLDKCCINRDQVILADPVATH